MKLLHGDCLELMKMLPDKSIDLVLTDPPYGTTACKWDSVIPFEPMWAELRRIRKGPICLFGSEPFSSALRMSNIKEFKYDWYWKKNMISGHLLAKKQPLRSIEIISVFYKDQCRYNPIFEEYAETTKQRFKNNSRVNNTKRIALGLRNNIQNCKTNIHDIHLKRGRYPSNLQSFKSEHTANGTRLHPTQKPVALLEYLIKTYTMPGETVLDFTMGSGSTGMACLNTKRKFIGIEKEDKYFKIANERLLFTPAATITMDDIEKYSHGLMLDSKGKSDE